MPSGAQETAFVRHMGARRFAYNQCLAAVKDRLDTRRHDPKTPVPWTGYDLINHFNGWKSPRRPVAVSP